MKTATGFAAESFLTEVLHAENIRIKGDEINHKCFLVDHEHDYKEPGASLNVEKMLWNCWKCGSGGTLLWITEEVLQVNGAKARALIKEYFDSEKVHEETFLQILESMWRKESVDTMPRYSMKMIEGFQCYTKLMDDRGITREVQKQMMTGLNKNNQDEVKVGGQVVKVVQPRIVIPHIFGGVLRGWTMRKVDKRQVGSKYKHTRQFPKDITLYNYDNAKQYNEVFVVESPFSALYLMSIGILNVVATFGAEVNPGQEDLLAKWDEVVFFPDGDRAGYKSLSRMDKRGNILGVAHTLGVRTNMFVIDHGITDDGEWNELDAANYSREEIDRLYSERVPAIMWDFVWEDEERGVQKVHEVNVRVGTEEGQWD